MKIAILTEIISTHSGSRAPIELAKNLSTNNKITLLAYAYSAEKNVEKELKKLGIKVVLINLPKLPLRKWLAALKFLPHLKGHDIISFHGTPPTFLIAKLSGIPLVKTYYGTQLDAYLERLLPYQKPSLKDKLLNWLGNQFILFVQGIYFGLSSQVVAISQYTSAEAQKLYGRTIPFVHLGASTLSSPSIPNTKYHISQKSRKAGIPNTILSVSRLTPYKGFHLLIKAVKKTGKKVNLFIVGPVSQPKYLGYLRKIKTPQTKILTDISDQELACLYQTCDIYATCDRYLFFGLPPLEAGLWEKPTVALDYCAAKEIVNHEKTGFVAKDLNEFSQYLKILIINPALRAKMGQEAKSWAEKNFSWGKTAQKYQKLFRQIALPTPRSKRIYIVIVFGLFLRLFSAFNKDFWFDEAISWSFAKTNINQMMTATLADNHPPFYYLFLHFWMKFNQSEFFLRLPSIIFGLISIFLIYLVTRKLFDKKVASISSLILALSPLHVYFSAETRMYSLWIMLTLATFYLFLKILKKPTKFDYLFFTLCSLLSLHTHYFSAFFLLALDGFLILKRKKYKKQLINLLLTQFGIGLLFLPWAFYFLVNPHPRPWGTSPLIGIPATFLSFVLGGVGNVTLKTFFAPTVPFLIRAVFIFAFALFAFLFLLGIKAKEKNEGKTLLLLLVFLPILATALISLFYPIYSPRPFLVFAPYFYILAARGLESLGKKWPKLIAIVLLSFILFIQNFYSLFKPQTLKETVKFIKRNSPNPQTIVHTDILTFYPFSYYFKEGAVQFLVFPSELTRKTTDIIGGSSVAFSQIAEKNRPFWSIHFTWDEKTWQFKKEQPRLEKNYKYDLVKTINDLEIFSYQPRKSTSLPSNK